MNHGRHLLELIQNPARFRRLTGKSKGTPERGQRFCYVGLESAGFFKFRDGAWEITLRFVCPAQDVMGNPEAGIQINGCTKLVYGFIVASRQIQALTKQEVRF